MGKKLLWVLIAFAAIQAQAQNMLTLNLTAKTGNNPFALNQNFWEYGGRIATMERLQYYLTNVALVHDGGMVTYLDSTYLLVDPITTSYIVGPTNITNVEKIRFSIGVDATVNHNDPNSWPNHHPLSMQNPSMHWGWTAGYKFAAFEGESDSNNDQDPDVVFQIHPTGDQLLRDVEVPVSASPTGNGILISLDYDVKQWLRGLDLPTVGYEHGDQGAAIVLMDNVNTYQVFRAAGTVSVDEVSPLAPSIHFNLIEPSRPIVHYRVPNATSPVSVQVRAMTGQLVYEKAGLPKEGKFRLDAPIANGIYVCTLMVDGEAVISKKLPVAQ